MQFSKGAVFLMWNFVNGPKFLLDRPLILLRYFNSWQFRYLEIIQKLKVLILLFLIDLFVFIVSDKKYRNSMHTFVRRKM